jgi:hypothetical protein
VPSLTHRPHRPCTIEVERIRAAFARQLLGERGQRPNGVLGRPITWPGGRPTTLRCLGSSSSVAHASGCGHRSVRSRDATHSNERAPPGVQPAIQARRTPHDREPLRVRRGARMTRILTVTFILSLGAAGLSGCYVVSPYASPPYAPPSPQYSPPSAPPPFGAGPTQVPGARGVPQGPSQNCHTVTVEGHAETIVRQNGQRETTWIPTHEQQVCQ